MLCLVAQLFPTLCDPTDCSLPDSSVHGDSPGMNTGVGNHSLLQGIFPTQGSNPGLQHCRWILYHLSHQGSPLMLLHDPIDLWLNLTVPYPDQTWLIHLSHKYLPNITCARCCTWHWTYGLKKTFISTLSWTRVHNGAEKKHLTKFNMHSHSESQ